MTENLPTLDDTHRVRDLCLCLHTQRAARTLARRFDEALRPFGLTNGQFSLLMSLNRPAAPPMTAVASLLGMDRTTLTAALKPLERRGLIQSVGDPSDRRARLLKLTDDGKALLARALPTWEALHNTIDASLADPDGVRAALKTLSDH